MNHPSENASSPASASNAAGRSIWGDLRNPRVIWFKGILFVVLTSFATIVLLLRRADVIDAILIAIVIWAACRSYYFAFYVIEHYVDPDFRFDGLLSLARHVIHNRRKR